MARLVWKRLDQEEKSFPVDRSALIGRGSAVDCDVDSKSVSRRHARIERRDQDFYIVDLGSTNGTQVNGAKIEAETALASGDLIVIGDEMLEFDVKTQDDLPELRTRGSQATEPLSGLVTASLQQRDRLSRVKDVNEVLPRRQGKFYLLERLGRGGMGTVYRAIDLDSNRQVAVKFIRGHIGRRESFLDFFHNREAVLAREIKHPNVIQIYEYGVDVDRHFISMEYVTGDSLYQTMKRHELRSYEVLELLRQISCGLAAAHRQGVVHSDIKPANILLASEDDSQPGTETSVNGGSRADETGDILEFESEFDVDSTEGRSAALTDDTVATGTDGDRFDAGLLEEIQRRVGVSSGDVLVDPPYFDRLAEASFLGHYLQRMLESRGHFVLVEGESGAGKTRLISNFLEHHKDLDPTADGHEPRLEFALYELDCSRVEGLPLLFEQIFETRPNAKDGAKALVKDLLSYFEEASFPIVMRILNFGSVTALVADFITRLAKFLPERRLMLVGALNPEELRANGALKPLLDRVAAETKELYIRPLTEYQIQRYLQQIFRNALPHVELASDLYRLSGGNFARFLDILRGFFEREILRADPMSGRIIYRPRAQEFELEEGKNLYEKYRLLGKVEQRVLEHAAFVGHRFLFDTLLKFHAIDETALFFIVRTLLNEGFFVEESRTWYGFTNLAFRNYIAGRFPTTERPHLHRKLSRLLASAPVPESAALLQLRANHLYGCKEYAKAVHVLLEGAHLARGQYESDLCRELIQEILRIYRELSRNEKLRKEVVGVLRDWYRRDGNWYEILGDLASQPNVPRVKIADFGISFRVRDQNRGYQVDRRPALGTPRYLAPERARGESGGPQADIFALGVLAYEMIVGKPPFPGLKGPEVMKANQEHKIVFPEDALVGYPEGTAALLEAMVDRDPERRWDAERILRTVLKLQFDQQVPGK